MDLTHDCPPTLTDNQVLEFCKTGLLRLDAIVPDEINKRVFQYCDQHNGAIPAAEDWYIENVTLNPRVIGPIRSLLVRDFTYPMAVGNRSRSGLHSDNQWLALMMAVLHTSLTWIVCRYFTCHKIRLKSWDLPSFYLVHTFSLVCNLG